MSVDTMDRSRAGGLRATAISIAAALAIGIATLATASAQTFEVPSNRLASQILPANLISGPYHQVREDVISYGYMHHYTVDSEFGVFEVTGDGALRKLVNEFSAIASLQEFKLTDAFLESVGKALAWFKGRRTSVELASVRANNHMQGRMVLSSSITQLFSDNDPTNSISPSAKHSSESGSRFRCPPSERICR